MDLLRSCYAANMCFFKDSDAVLPVVWYFVPNDRETLPFATVFASRLYERGEEPEEHLGERYSPVPWRGGQPPGPVPKCGNCGSADAWVNGVLSTDPFPQTYPGTNVPLCCCPPDPQFFGQAAHGGIIATPFRGEAAGGGILLEPFHGEAAGGGSFVASNLFLGEGAGGGIVTEPFIGEAASGGVFAIGEMWYGGSAAGGEFAVGVEFDGGSAGGGSFTAVDNTVSVACATYRIKKQINFLITSTTGTCGCAAATFDVLNYNFPVSGIWGKVVSICGNNSTVQLGCVGGVWKLGATSTSGVKWNFTTISFVDNPGTATWSGAVTPTGGCVGTLFVSLAE